MLIKDIERAYLGGTPERENYSGFEIAEDEAERRAEEYEDAKKWYLDIFGGIEADSMPVPDRHEEKPSFGAAETDLLLEAGQVGALCSRYGVTENVFATAAFGVCLALYAGMTESLFTTIYNGRDSLRTARSVRSSRITTADG